MPTSWQDLLKPEYKGKLVMPNPASSGTGYLHVASILQMMGEEKGWAYLDALDKNMEQYIKSRLEALQRGQRRRVRRRHLVRPARHQEHRRRLSRSPW